MEVASEDLSFSSGQMVLYSPRARIIPEMLRSLNVYYAPYDFSHHNHICCTNTSPRLFQLLTWSAYPPSLVYVIVLLLFFPPRFGSPGFHCPLVYLFSCACFFRLPSYPTISPRLLHPLPSWLPFYTSRRSITI